MRTLLAAVAAMAVIASAPLVNKAEAARTVVDCERDDLQVALDGAAPGERLWVSGTCIGNFTITKDVRVLGRGGATVQGVQGTVLTIAVGAKVTLTDLTVTGGSYNNRDRNPIAGGIFNNGALTLNGETVVRGNSASDLSGYEGMGGGIYNNGTLTMNDSSSVRENGAPTGGGIYNNTTGLVRLNDNATVSNNYAVWSGGGIAMRGTVTLNGKASVTGNSVLGHSGVGGGISNGGTLTLNDRSRVSGNESTEPGGGIANSGVVILNDRSSVSGNRAYGAAGIYTYGAVVMNDRSSVSGNTARAAGGGIAGYGASVVTLNDASSVTGNTAVYGGGIAIAGTLTLKERSSVRGNTALSHGGGVCIATSEGVTGTVSGVVGRVSGNVPDQVYEGCRAP